MLEAAIRNRSRPNAPNLVCIKIRGFKRSSVKGNARQHTESTMIATNIRQRGRIAHDFIMLAYDVCPCYGGGLRIFES